MGADRRRLALSIIGYTNLTAAPLPLSLTARVKALFAKYSGVGGYWDFTDIATLSQDSAGTTPVTASGQPVGRALDKSGQGSHFIQSVASSRPQYNGAGLTPDDVDDYMETAANLNLTACDKVVLAIGYTKVNDVAWLEIGGDDIVLTSGTGDDGQRQWFYSKRGGSFDSSRAAHFTSNWANGYGAHIGRASIPANLGEVWWNGVKGVDAVGTMGGGTFGNSLIYLISHARRALAMGVPVAGTQVSDDDIELIRLWLMEGVV